MLQNMCLAKFAVSFDVASNSIGEMNNCDDDVTKLLQVPTAEIPIIVPLHWTQVNMPPRG